MALFKTEQKENAMSGDTKYSRSMKIPQYLPTNIKPNVNSLVDYEKYSRLIKNINESNVDEEEKKFLKLAACRHIVFNYSLIADYYANSNREMQELMEESALVILDIEDAIANGYVELSDKLRVLINESRAIRGK